MDVGVVDLEESQRKIFLAIVGGVTYLGSLCVGMERKSRKTAEAGDGHSEGCVDGRRQSPRRSPFQHRGSSPPSRTRGGSSRKPEVCAQGQEGGGTGRWAQPKKPGTKCLRKFTDDRSRGEPPFFPLSSTTHPKRVLYSGYPVPHSQLSALAISV